ncbi:MAG TPA: type IV pilus twitching motility protein PilT [Myxococcaceae bacterium]|nr:type IV pilus twitching motility protein PilT [Myxococcaceae bacterium]
MARLDPIFERLLREGTELLFDTGAPAVMRTGTGDVPVLRQQLSAQQIAGVFAEVVPSEMRTAFPAPGVTTFEYGAPAGRVAVTFERNGGQVRAMVRPADKGAEEEGEAIELASAAEMLHEYMHGPGTANPGKPPTPAATGIPTGSQPGIPMGSQSGARRGVAKDIQFRELPGGGKGPTRTGAQPIAPAPAEPAAPAKAKVAAAPTPASDPRAAMDQLLNYMLDRKASDLHVSSDTTPIIRVDGDMTPIEGHPPLSSSRLKDMLFSIAPEKNREQWLSIKDTDFAYETPRARFRVNLFDDRKGIGSVMRQIPNTIRTAQEMGLPQHVLDLCFLNKGLVVVTGPTGSGKSTTLASMIDHINRNRDDHIITIEDPIEFVHPNLRCLVNQREIGVHTGSFKHALRAALREDPDIVLVGEMRDLETIAIAIETAETGHLVFGTLHTNTAPSTVDRIIDQFPADRQEQIRMMLSESLKGVITQTLCKKIGGGRIAAMEILIATSGVANLIREGKTFQIPSAMQTGKNVGMQTLNDALFDLVKKKLVEPQEAYSKAIHKAELKLMLERGGFKLEAEAA